jgi:hypothetical protein
MTWLFPYHMSYLPSTNIIPWAKVFEMIFVSWIDTGCETKNKQNKENVILCPRMAFWMHVGNETVIVPNITMFLHYVSQWGGWICLWINRIFHCNNSIGTRSPFCCKRQNMPLKINLICIWHHHLVHCFLLCLKCKSNKA